MRQRLELHDKMASTSLKKSENWVSLGPLLISKIFGAITAGRFEGSPFRKAIWSSDRINRSPTS